MPLSNYHTHTYFCDGSSKPEAYVEAAINAGFTKLGFSGHAPMPFANTYAIKNEELTAYCLEINNLKEKYKAQLDIFLALEIDYIPEYSADFKSFKNNCKLDYTIGSVHLVSNPENKKLWFIDGGKIEEYDQGLNTIFDRDIRKGVKAFYHQTMEMLTTQKPDIIGHMDKIKMNNRNRYFQPNEKWYQNLVLETLNVIKEQHTIVEINTRGIYKKRSDELFPGIEILKQIKEMQIPVIISSDAHKPEELSSGLVETRNVLKNIGFTYICDFDGKTWREIAI